MTVRDSRAFLFDAVAVIDAILQYSADYDWDRFAADRIMQDAVERQLITLGEIFTRLRRDFPEVASRVPVSPLRTLLTTLIDDPGA